MKKETKEKGLSVLGAIGAGVLTIAGAYVIVEAMQRDIEIIKTGSTNDVIKVFENAYTRMVIKDAIDKDIKYEEMETIKFIVNNTKQSDYSQLLVNKLTKLNERYHIYY